VSPDRFSEGYTPVQIHKDGSLLKVYEQGKEENMEIEEELYDFLMNIDGSYVVEGFYAGKDEFVVWDVLCWNDIWIFRRPLAERIKLLWHFSPNNETTLHAWNLNGLKYAEKEWNSKVILRNLNAPYDLTDHSTHIFMGDMTVLLQVGGRRGGKSNAFLNSSDKKSVFSIPLVIDKEDWGDVVEVNEKGDVLKVMPDGFVPDSWDIVARKWDKPLIYEDWAHGIRLPRCNWISDKEEV
jgi:hypothetical protein